MIAPAGQLAELRARWAAWRELLQQSEAHVNGAALLDKVLAELDVAIQTLDRVPLTLSEAAKQTGYSTDHLARLVRTGKLANAGRKHAPRLAPEDVARLAGHRPPTPPNRVAEASDDGYDPIADARSLMRRRQGA